ncbi:MAG: S41 family peptidase [Chloroflexota bacterium]|nr:S41 family peptidase [Chloroflexota bacterium]
MFQPFLSREEASPRSTTRSRLSSRLLNVVVILAVFGAGIGIDRTVLRGSLPAGAADTFTEHEDFDVLESTWDLIQNEWVLADETEDEDLIYGAAAGMVEALGDEGHSAFLSPEQAEQFNESSLGEFTGVGIEIGERDGNVVVIAPIDNSPALEAGIKSGDILIEVNGESIDGLEVFEIGQEVRGEEGTGVQLTLRRPDDEVYTVDLIRRRIVVISVSWRMLPDDLAHVRIARFDVGVTRELQTALEAAREAGAVGIVLDLRDNPGGLVSEAIGVASQFMEEGNTIFQYQTADQDPYPVKTIGYDGLWLEEPLVVLVNEGSASAAEIVSGSLRDNDRATLLGETTFGTGTVLTPFEQPDGSIVLLGTALWLTADGDQIWREGVEPDIAVELPADVSVSRPSDETETANINEEPHPDAQLQAAFDLLSEQVAGPAASPEAEASPVSD